MHFLGEENVITPLKMCHFSSLSLSSRKVVRISPTDPTLCHHHPSLTHLSELWLQDVVLKSRETRNWHGAEGQWWSKRIPQGTERQGRTPVQLSWRELSRAEQSWVEQGWVGKEVVLGAATWNGVQHPEWQQRVKTKRTQAPAQQSSGKVWHRHPRFWGLVCYHCFLLSRAQGWEEAAAGSSLPLSLTQGITAYRESLPTCLCPSGHAGLHWGGKHLLCIKHLLSFYTFVIVLLLLLSFFLFH